MDIPCNIESLKTAHEKLWREVVSNLPTNKEKRGALIVEAENLISNIESCSAQVTTSEEYTWLSGAAVQWQSVFSSVLGMPRNVNLAPSPQPVKLPAQKPLADDREVDTWIRENAHYHGIIRRAQNLHRDLGDILQRAEETGTDSEAQIAEDWHRATVYFACEVIDGRVDLIRQLSVDTYYRLESVWLKDVKEVKAYFIWRRTKGAAEDNYDIACEQIRDRLLSCAKGSADEFQETRRYIEGRYLTNDGIRPDVNETARKVIAIKAKRVWESTGGIYSNEANWISAERYTKMFYENIIPAVAMKNVDSAEMVLKAFGFSRSPENRYLIINAFEAAIAIYFLDADVIRELLDKKRVTYMIL